MEYKPTIGLEIHAELKTASKMFCSCKNDPDEKRPNYNICPICTAQPGTLPVANQEAVKKVIKTGLALNCKIAEDSKFDRKNYFYPDLPKGYQISQYDQPLCTGGYLEIAGKKIGITRIHLEEDTGRLAHPEGADYSLVDYNRAGIPLMELVTEPDISSGKEAREFAQELQLILRYLGVSNADMEKGQMRVEVNVSLIASNGFLPMINYIESEKHKYIDVIETGDGKKWGILPAGTIGTKVEIKNLNSFRVVEKAIDFEIKRQEELLEKGERVVQETRGWHDKKEITFSQREKEEAHDYRYFPEPDLLPMHFDKNFIEEIKNTISELPEQKRKRFLKEYGLDKDSIEVFVENKDLSEYYEKVVSEFEEWTPEEERGEAHKKVSKLVANYLISDVQGLLQGKEFVETEFKITSENFAEFIKMIYKEEISSKVAKIVLLEMFNTGVDPSSFIDDNNLRQISDDSAIEKIIKEVIEKNPEAAANYKAGKENILHFLAGQVMKETRGTAKPEKVHELFKKFLK
jgi:aspartyl-tRNA(Asn)/glutamyl-tRNA(Gln) amidotransferase subunit B